MIRQNAARTVPGAFGSFRFGETLEETRAATQNRERAVALAYNATATCRLLVL
jgi:hypothetical protein